MNKIWELIKKALFFFRKKEEIPHENNEESINEESIKLTNINWELINRLKENDIVLVKMRDDEISKNNVEESHQKRPFIIQEKIDDEQSVCGYYLTSNIDNGFFKNAKNRGLKVVLSHDTYNLNKNSLILLHRESKLPYGNIIHLLDHLNNKDLSKLKKYRNLLCNSPVFSDKENELIDIGDIILHNNKKYVIYQMDNTNCYGYPIIKTTENIDLKENHNYIKFNAKIYFVDYKNSRVFGNKDKLFIIGRWNYDTVDVIKHNKKVLKHELNNKNNKNKRYKKN